MFRPSLEKNHIQKEDARDAVIQAMIEVDVEEREDLLSFSLIFTMFCNVLIITGYNKKQVVIS